MIHTDFHWQSKDGLQLYARCWEPDTQPKGVVCLVHGLGEHSGRYEPLANFLVRSGYALLAFDLRGHGKSQGQRGHVPAFNVYMDDIGLLVENAADRFPGLPLFLYGHSLGSILVLNFVLRRKPDLAGVIVTGLALRSALEKQKLKIAMVKILGSLFPTFSIPSGLDVNFLSSDPEVVRRYVNDPLVHTRATLGWAKALLPVLPWTFEHAREFSTPLLMMHGTGDRIANPESTDEFARKVGCECRVKLWEDYYHEIHNEPEGSRVFDFCLEWLENHTRMGKDGRGG